MVGSGSSLDRGTVAWGLLLGVAICLVLTGFVLGTGFGLLLVLLGVIFLFPASVNTAYHHYDLRDSHRWAVVCLVGLGLLVFSTGLSMGLFGIAKPYANSVEPVDSDEVADAEYDYSYEGLSPEAQAVFERALDTEDEVRIAEPGPTEFEYWPNGGTSYLIKYDGEPYRLHTEERFGVGDLSMLLLWPLGLGLSILGLAVLWRKRSDPLY